MKPNELKEQRAQLVADARKVHDIAEAEERNLTDDEQTRFDDLMSKADELEGRIARQDKLGNVETDLAKSTRKSDPQPVERRADVKIEPVRYTKLKAFQDERKAYESGQWIRATFYGDESAQRWCRDNGIEHRAQTIGSAGGGGNLVPTPLFNAVLDVLENSGVARRISRVVPMSENTLGLPKRTGGLTVEYPGEATAGSGSDRSWGKVNMICVKRMVYNRWSSEVAEDAIISLADDTAQDVGRAFAQQEDNELVNGDGSGTYGGETGLLTALGAAGKLNASGLTWSAVTLSDLNGLCALLPEKYHSNARFLMSRAYYANVVQKLIYAAGGNTAQTIAGGTGAQVFGYPVEFSDQMPTATAEGQTGVLFGDFFNSVVIGIRRDLDIALDNSRHFDSDEIAFRAIQRYDINVHEGGGAENVGGYVGLVTTSSS